MDIKKLSKSSRKFIRAQKARIRRSTSEPEEQERSIEELRRRFS